MAAIDFQLLGIFILMLTVANAATQEQETSAQTYWRSILPQTPIPASILDLLPQEEKESNSFDLKRDPSLFVGYNRNPSLFVGYKRNPSLFVNYNRNPSLFVNYNRNPSLFVNYNRNPSLFVNYKRDPSLFVNYNKNPSLFVGYKGSAAGENQVHNDPNAPLFFLKDNLKPGLKMSLDLTKSNAAQPFLSADKAKAVPFSSNKLPEILNIFGIQADSAEAATVQRTLEECEVLPLEGESKRCVLSLEGMVEFVQAELGHKDVRVAETAVAGSGDEAVPTQEEYVVGPQGGKQLRAEAMVSCHPEPYPSAVYYCHRTRNIEVQKVQLLREDGGRANAVAICHTDTAAWNPKYPVFELLNVKPGTKSICHFVPPGHLIFASISKKDISAV